MHEPEFLLEYLKDILQEPDLKAPIRKIHFGKKPVYRIGDKIVVKFFSEEENDLYASEIAALELLSCKPDIHTPHILSSGMSKGWHYIVMTNLSGCNLSEIWDDLEYEEQIKSFEKLGLLMGVLHKSTRSTSLDDKTKWSDFLLERRDNCLKRQQDCGVKNYWIHQIPEFIDYHIESLLQRESFCLVHSELVRENIMIDRTSKELKLGLIDFEQSRIAIPEFEFGATGIFLTSGNTEMIKALFDGYMTVNHEFRYDSGTILALALLHPQSNLKWCLDVSPKADSLQKLANVLWPTLPDR